MELLYDPAAVAVQIRDKHNDFIWSSAFDSSAYAYEADEALARGLATLFQIVYTDAEGITSTVRSHDEGVNIRAEKLENGVSLHASFPDIAMAMTVEIWLDEEGLNARIPQDGLEETGGYRLVSVDLLPMLARPITAKRDIWYIRMVRHDLPVQRIGIGYSQADP